MQPKEKLELFIIGKFNASKYDEFILQDSRITISRFAREHAFSSAKWLLGLLRKLLMKSGALWNRIITIRFFNFPSSILLVPPIEESAPDLNFRIYSSDFQLIQN